jgi:Tfp pilus assembly protein PilE
MNKNKVWFTIVELIVVITILSILSTIWFISYSWYLVWVRDTNRMSQLTSISEWLNVLRTKGKLPLPDNRVTIKSSLNTIAYQWVIGKTVLSTIDYSNSWLDPQENMYFSYYLTANRKYFQLMGFLEDKANLVTWIVNDTYAIDYSVKYPIVMWSKLWILTTNTNQPLAEYLLAVPLPDIDIEDVSAQSLKSYLTNTEFVTWTGTTFSELKNIAKKWWKYYSVISNTYVYDEPVY